MPPRPSIVAALLLSCLLATSCVHLSWRKKALVTFASEPPGANVIIDGRDSGFVTPCLLALPPGGGRRVDLQLNGYEPVRRRLRSDVSTYVIEWNEMWASTNTWRLPLWLNARDLFAAIRIKRAQSPRRIFVRFERSADR